MTRFDFLHDGLPDAVEAALAFRLPRRLRTAAVAFVTLVFVLLACASLEVMRSNAATATEAAERTRLDAAQGRLASADLELHEVTQLLETDRRLRAVRASGTLAVLRLARVGNAVPRGVWLSSLEPSPTGLSVEGEAVSVEALDRILSNFVSNEQIGRARLLRMARIARSSAPALVSFAIELQEDR